jgi:hypothetical protein
MSHSYDHAVTREKKHIGKADNVNILWMWISQKLCSGQQNLERVSDLHM